MVYGQPEGTVEFKMKGEKANMFNRMELFSF